MSKKNWIVVFLIGMGALSGAFLLWKQQEPSPAAAIQKDVYYCPMHKDYTSDKPGNCPICSMKLVKKGTTETQKVGANQPTDTNPAEAPVMQQSSSSESRVFISPERRQTIGVRSVPVERRKIAREIRTVGTISYDETNVTHVHTKVSGWVQDVFVDFIGAPVRRGQALFSIYSPELVTTQEEYLLASRSKEELQKSSFDWVSRGSESLADAALQRLRLWDVSEEEIHDLEKSSTPKRTLNVFSPAAGVVTERSAYHHGMYVTPDMELYTIVDLSNVWILADIYEMDLPLISTGQKIQIQFPYAPELEPLEGKISFLYPTINPQTRTGQVRIEVRNPNLQFKLNQYVNAVIRSAEVDHLVVPSDSALNTGQEQYVFVDLGDGYFEPRKIRMGIQTPEGIAVEEGLREGERVVTSAAFLLDSESRLQGVLETMGKPSQHEHSTNVPQESLRVEILEPKAAKTGENAFKVSIRDASGKPITGAQVEFEVSMPAMVNMPAMSNQAALLEESPGIYVGTIQIPVAWTWKATILVKKNRQLLGSAQLSIPVR